MKAATTILLFCYVILAQTDSILSGGIYRSFIVYAPAGLSNPPLVVNIHGLSMDANMEQTMTGFNKIADREKIIVVYPNGIDKKWDISGTADVSFILALIDTLDARYSINRNRVYSTGFSMGGFMSHHLGNVAADTIAAIAPVAGLVVGRSLKPSRPMPVLQIHGTADSTVPYSGVPATISAWVKANGCPETPLVTSPYPSTKAESKVVKEYYGPCNGSSEVVLLTVNGLGHNWPGGGYGGSSDISASEEIWEFFKQHSLDPLQAGGKPETARRKRNVTIRYDQSGLRLAGAGAISAVCCCDSKGRSIGNWTICTAYRRHGEIALPMGAVPTPGIYLLSFKNGSGLSFSRTFAMP
ncbi:MAG: hypothetical protein JW863_00195 [Chitinispirillaceae bacterium]|nr:hypothetical protein [Chitinispirillaceae bacterium]